MVSQKYKNVVAGLLFLATFNTYAGMDVEQKELAKQSQNPVGNMYSVPLEVWHHDGLGIDEKGGANALFLKPVVPVAVGDLNLISR